MTATLLPKLVRTLRVQVRSAHVDHLSDAQLLERFSATGDEAAFEALLRRHGPLVRGACRRVLGDGPDADDAFQAAFLVLARKAGAIRQAAAVSCWLYGVARRLSCQLRRRTACRRDRERAASLLLARLTEQRQEQGFDVDRPGDLTWNEEYAVLEEELTRLPEKYRAPLLLCYLQGRSNVEAARQLGWPLGTVKSRLMRAREILRARLTRRGIALAAGAILPSGAATAALSESLVASTRQAALAFAAGKAVSSATSAGAVGLAAELLREMALGKLTFTGLLPLLLGVLVWGAGALRGDDGPAALPPPTEAARPAKIATDRLGDPLPPGALARLGTTRLRHGREVPLVGFLPGGKTVLTASRDGTLRQWEVPTGKELRRVAVAAPDHPDDSGGLVLRLGGGGPNAADAVLSRDGKVLATLGTGGSIRLWDAVAGKESRKLVPPGGGVAGMALSTDGKLLAILGSDSTVRVLETAKGNQIARLGEPVMENPNGVFLILGGGRGSSPARLAFSPDGATLAVVLPGANGKPASFKLWDARNGKERRRLEGADVAAAVAPAFSPNGKLLAWARPGAVILADAVTGKMVHRLKLDAESNLTPAFSFAPDGQTLAARDSTGRIALWSVHDGKRLRAFALTDAASGPGTLAFSPDSKLLAVSEGGAVRLLDAANGKELPGPTGHRAVVSRVAYAANGRTVLTWGEAGAGGDGRVWDAVTGKELRRVRVPEGAVACTPSADGRLLACVHSDRSVRLWDAATGKEQHRLAVPKTGSTLPVFVPGDRLVAVQGIEKGKVVVAFFDVATGKSVRRIDVRTTGTGQSVIEFPISRSSGFAFAPDGKVLAVPLNSSVVGLWDVDTGRRLRTIQVPERQAVRGITFAPDGYTLALDLGEGRLGLWETATGRSRGLLRAKQKSVNRDMMMTFIVANGVDLSLRAVRPAPRLAFSPDGRLLAQALADGAVVLWDAAAGKEVRRLHGHEAPVEALAFAPSGNRLATVSRDTTGLIWDAAARTGTPPPVRPLAGAELERRWAELAGDDAARAYEAVCALSAASGQAVPLLKQRVRPAVAADAERIGKLIKELSSEMFTIRSRAFSELEKAGESTAPLLRRALMTDPPLETRRRLEDLLERVSGVTPAGDRLRQVRAVEVLERAGTPEAREVLRTLAGGAPEALVTRTARASLARHGN